MLSSLLYITLSVIEGLVTILYSLSIFRINIKPYIKETIITSVIISIGSYFYKASSLDNISIMLNLIGFFFFLTFVFKISPLYSSMIAASGFLSFLIVQGLVASLVNLGSGMSLTEMNEIAWLRNTLQIVSDLIVFAATLFIIKKRIGFTFVPFEFSLSLKLTKFNIVVVLSSIVTALITTFAFRIDNLMVGTAFWVAGFVFIMLIGSHKEAE